MLDFRSFQRILLEVHLCESMPSPLLCGVSPLYAIIITIIIIIIISILSWSLESHESMPQSHYNRDFNPINPRFQFHCSHCNQKNEFYSTTWPSPASATQLRPRRCLRPGRTWKLLKSTSWWIYELQFIGVCFMIYFITHFDDTYNIL